MPAGYTPLTGDADQDRELNEAFDDDDEDAQETTPLAGRESEPQQRPQPATTSSGYDFEREYAYNDTADWMAPPPGSPTGPSATALPNDHGNSNGLVPSSPVMAPTTSRSAPSFFRRAVGAILPTHYARLPTSDAEASRTRGGGTENDGVFANLMGKPQPAQTIRTSDGDIHMVPEATQKEVPPSYVEAQADSTPPYWETTVHAPAALDADGEMMVDDLPTGSFITFMITMAISFFFQFIGFLLTFLLHTSHAGKYGSRAGLGLTLIQYGFYSKTADMSGTSTEVYYGTSLFKPHGPSPTDDAAGVVESRHGGEAVTPEDDSYVVPGGFSTKDWLAFILMTIGWFLLLSSVIGFCRVKRWERRIRESASAPAQAPLTPEQMQRDNEVRQTLENVFGLPAETPMAQQNVRDNGRGHIIVIPNQQALEEERLTRDLRAAGLL